MISSLSPLRTIWGGSSRTIEDFFVSPLSDYPVDREWGFDFVKHDTCMQNDLNCTVHNDCIQDATKRMRDALYHASQGSIFYYLDSGNPSNEMKLYNPRGHHLDHGVAPPCIAQNAEELSWRWATSLDGASTTKPGKGPHMIKAMYDIEDVYESTMINVHALIRTAPYQTCKQMPRLATTLTPCK